MEAVDRNNASPLRTSPLNFSVCTGHRKIAVEKSLDDGFRSERQRVQCDPLTEFASTVHFGEHYSSSTTDNSRQHVDQSPVSFTEGSELKLSRSARKLIPARRILRIRLQNVAHGKACDLLIAAPGKDCL
jgi:hypothetical protein